MSPRTYARRHAAPCQRRGSTLFLVVVLVVGLAGFAAALAGLTGAGYLENRTTRESVQAFHLCEAGLSEAWATLLTAGEEELVDRFDAPRDFGPDAVDVLVQIGGDDPTLASTRIRVVATTRVGGTSQSTAFVAERIPNGFFRHAIFAYEEVVLESNSRVDTYDSSRGGYDPDLTGVVADVGTNGDIELYANMEVFGGLTCGPEGVIDDQAPQTFVAGTMETAVELVEVEEIEVPSIPRLPGVTIRGPMALGPGDLHLARLKVDGGADLRIVGPTRLVLDDFSVLSNANVTLDASLGPIEIHCTGDVELRSNSTIASQTVSARDVLLNVAWEPDDSHEILLASNAEFVGVINAPYSELEINSNFEVFGGIRADSILLESNAQVHFDEDLLYDDDRELVYALITWSRGDLGTD